MREDKHIEREKMNKYLNKFDEFWWLQEERLRLLHKIKENEDHSRWIKQKRRKLRARIKFLTKQIKRDFVTGWKSDAELDEEFEHINKITHVDPILCWLERNC